MLWRLLAVGLRFRPIRRLFARMHWPRPAQLAKLNTTEFQRYIRAIGFEADAQAALAEFLGDHDQGKGVPGVRSEKGGVERPRGAAVP